MKFQLLNNDPNSKARAGILSTDHGDIPTPIFMPVGTLGTVKAVHQRELKDDIQAKIILGNTYHLYLRPGMNVMEAAGGLHKFINWDGPMLTDSGGYQVFSLASQRKLSEEGVTFKSHIDGSSHLFTPESVIETQRKIGADIIMALDECPPYPCEHDYALKSMHLTHRWAERCKVHMKNTQPLYGHEQSLFPIIQGGTYKDLRKQSAETLVEMDFDGNAIGGLSVGEPNELMYEMTEWTTQFLPENKPRYLMGVGTPENLLECISLGIDMFDCVMPTRNARHGLLFTREGIRNLRNSQYEKDFTPIDPLSDYWPDQVYTKAYLRHLFKSQELLALQIGSLHNLYFYLWLIREAREKIIEGNFTQWKKEILPIITRKL